MQNKRAAIYSALNKCIHRLYFMLIIVLNCAKFAHFVSQEEKREYERNK